MKEALACKDLHDVKVPICFAYLVCDTVFVRTVLSKSIETAKPGCLDVLNNLETSVHFFV